LDKAIFLPQDLKKIKDLEYKKFQACVFTKYTQKDCSYSSFVEFSTNVLIFVKKGYKILHSANKDYPINTNEALFLKAGSYVLSNIPYQENYEVYLFFFDNAFLIELIYKYQAFYHTEESENKGIFWVRNDLVLCGILESFNPHFEENTQILDPLIALKFEEIFLHLFLSKNKHFIAFLSVIFKEFKLNLAQLFTYCNREFLSVNEMACFARLDLTSFSKEFKKCFGICAKQWLDEKRLQKAKILLEFSSKNVNEIATECGFGNVSWFILRFKEKFHQTPKKYQKSKNPYFLSKN